MAEELEAVVVTCGKCNAKFRLKPGVTRFLKDVKCTKCGARIPLSGAKPAAAAADTPAEVPAAPAPATPAPAPAPAAATPATTISTPVATAPATSSAPDEVTALKQSIADLEARLAVSGRASAELEASQERVVELTRQLAAVQEEARANADKIAQLEQQIAQARSPSAELEEMQTRLTESEERVSELQQLWYQKEKESREAFDQTDEARKQRDAAVLERDRLVAGLRDMLSVYHSNEAEISRKRLADLEDRIGRFLALTRPPAEDHGGA